MIAILAAAVFLSDNRRAISRRVVFWGLALQWGFALLVLRVPAGARFFARRGQTRRIDPRTARSPGPGSSSAARSSMRQGPAGFVFAFRVLPTVIFVAALFAVLYHLGVMQWVVRGFAVVMAKLMGTSGAESLNVAASLFLGPDRGPADDPPLSAAADPVRAAHGDDLGNGARFRRCHGGVHQLRNRGAAHPDRRDHDGPRSDLAIEDPGPGDRRCPRLTAPWAKPRHAADANVLDAAARGTRDGLHLALNIAAMLISFLALVELVNLGLGYVGHSLQDIVGWAMAPVAYMLGVAWEDCKGVGKLLGTRTVLNELIAFNDLGVLKKQRNPDRSLGRDRQLRPLRLRQYQLDRHSARRHRGACARAPARPGPAGFACLVRRNDGQLPFGLHRGNLAMTATGSSPIEPSDVYSRAPGSRGRASPVGGNDRPRVAIVLGSGLNDLAGRVQDATVVPYASVPHFPATRVAGHAGQVLCGKLAGQTVIVFQGRFHYYEGHDLETVTFPVRVIQELGVKLLILTAATGGIREGLRPGTLMLLSDHLNLIGCNPLRGPNDERLGTRFPDMSEVYSSRLRAIALEEASRHRPGAGMRRLRLPARPQLRDSRRDQDAQNPGCRRRGNVDGARGDRGAARGHRGTGNRPGIERRSRCLGRARSPTRKFSTPARKPRPSWRA